MSETRDFLRSIDLPPGDANDLPDSAKRFPDGAQYRIEIPSTEGPRCLEAVLEEAARLDVTVHRVSQGSGVFMLTDDELDHTARLAADARVEVSLFARPNAAWDTSAAARAPAGGVFAPTARGQEQVVACLDDALRAADHGFRSVLIADIGVLSAFAARTPCRPPARGHAGEDLGDAAGRQPARRPRPRRPRGGHDQPADRPERSRRSPQSAPRSTSRSTSTSRRRTTSAASSATTRSRS